VNTRLGLALPLVSGDPVDKVADKDQQAVQGQHLVDGDHARMRKKRGERKGGKKSRKKTKEKGTA
jgi:hypothetical protein